MKLFLVLFVFTILLYCDTTQGDTAKVKIEMPKVHPSKKDSYICTSLKLPEHDSYIVEYEPSAHKETVHHMLLFGCDEPGRNQKSWNCGNMGVGTCGSDYESILFGWAKDAPSLDLPKDVGFKVGGKSKIKYLVLQIHYVNPLEDGQYDSSGVILHMTDTRQPNIASIYLLLAFQAYIPPHTKGTHVDVACEYDSDEEIHAFAFRTHAHDLGRVITGYRIRNNNWTLLGKGDPQAPQAFYPMKTITTIKKGDILAARCTYDTYDTDRTEVTNIGSTANDEMCNFYMMYYRDAQSHAERQQSCVDQSTFKNVFRSFPNDSDVALSLSPGHHHHHSQDVNAEENTAGGVDQAIDTPLQEPESEEGVVTKDETQSLGGVSQGGPLVHEPNSEQISLTTSSSRNSPTDDITNPAHDVTNPGHDVTNPGHDVTNPTHDVTNPTHDVTNPTHDVTNPTHDVTNPTHDGTNNTDDVTKSDDVQNNTDDVTDNTDDVTDNTDDVTKSDDIQNNTDDVTDNTDDVQKNTDDVTDNTDAVMKSDDIQNNTDDVTDNTDDVQNNTDDVTDNTDVTKSDDVQNNTDDVTDNTDDVQKNTDDVTDNTDDVTKSDDVQNNTDDVTDNTDDVQNNTDDVTDNTDDVTDNTDGVTKSKSRLYATEDNVWREATTTRPTDEAPELGGDKSSDYVTHDVSTDVNTSTSVSEQTTSASQVTYEPTTTGENGKQGPGESDADFLKDLMTGRNETTKTTAQVVESKSNEKNGVEKGHDFNLAPSKSNVSVVDGWPSSVSKRLGQVTGLAMDSAGRVFVFHRGERTWDAGAFNDNNIFRDARTRGTIRGATLLILDGESGKLLKKWGRNMFYLPHGLAIDHEDNVWITDVGRHQVMKFSRGEFNQPSLILGEKLIPGSDEKHFCKPTDVAVEKSGIFYVADGYCNGRIMKFSAKGKLLKEWGSLSRKSDAGPGTFSIPHSLALDEKHDMLYVADRENGRVQCFDTQGKFHKMISSKMFGGRVFAINYNEQDHVLYAVNGPGKAKVQGFTIDPTTGKILASWSPHGKGFSRPHDVISSGSDIYVAEIGPNRVWKMQAEYFTSPRIVESKQMNYERGFVIEKKPTRASDEGNTKSGDQPRKEEKKSNFIATVILTILSVPVVILLLVGLVSKIRGRKTLQKYDMMDETLGNRSASGKWCSSMNCCSQSYHNMEELYLMDSDSDLEIFPDVRVNKK